MWLFRKHVSVMNNKKFIAAYSTKPFAEAKRNNAFPDYSFFESGGLYWCLRVGDIEVPWGFGVSDVGYSANGCVMVSRQNVDATSFDGKGLPFIKQGEISYLYESELFGGNFEGYSTYLRDELLLVIRKIARGVDANHFPDVLEEALRTDPKVKELLKSNVLTLKSVRVDKVTETQTAKIVNIIKGE